MGEADLALAREFVRTYNAREIDAMAAICHEDVEARSIYAGIEAGGVFTGREGFPYVYFQQIDEAWDFFVLEHAEYEDLGGGVVVITCDMFGCGKQSGAEFRQRIYVVWRTRDGMLWRERTIIDEAEARTLAERWSRGDG